MNLNDLCTRLADMPNLPRRLAVHPKTYQELIANSDMRFDPNTSQSVAGGFMGSLWGVDIITSTSVPEGQVMVWNAESRPFEPATPIPRTAPRPPSPFDQVHHITQVGPDEWEARDANGQLLMELTERGARDLAEERGLSL